MSILKPPSGYKRGLSDRACHDMAERALRSPLGQEALQQGWGSGLYRYVMAWGSTPTMPQIKEALKRQANEFLWHLGDMRKIEKPDELTKTLIKFSESRQAREAELREKFYRSDQEE